jgi:CRP-like cAMP-binding protein/anti-anti-sigma regulatory factor
MGFGMFALVPLGDKYFANGALAGLYAAFFVAFVSVALGDKTTTVYAPRINSTFFLGALLYGLVHSEIAGPAATSTALIEVVFFLIIFLGGVFQAFFGIVKVGFIAVMLFVVRMSRSIIRRSYRCNAISSRKSRDSRESKALERHGGSILVMELQGALFFGTGERLIDEIEAATQSETHSLILDLRRVSEIDSTGERIILDVQTNLTRNGRQLGLVLSQHGDVMPRLEDLGVFEHVSADHIFEDVDRAIEWAEDNLLHNVLDEPPPTHELPLEKVGILHDFDRSEIAALELRLIRVAHPKGAMIFRQGDSGMDLFIVTKGTASAYIHQPTGRAIRLVTFAPGTVFGEFAILDAGPRSASIIADDDFVCFALSRAQFAALSAEAPAIAIKLLANLGRELSSRLRRADRMIDELETRRAYGFAVNLGLFLGA